jgi:predicted RNA-binding protein
MAYYLDLFSPETCQMFSDSDQTISGFRITQQNMAGRIKPGDKLLCYVTRLSRWVGILEVTSESFQDSKPIFTSSDDPFIVRFRVKPTVWLPLDKAIPIKEEKLWKKLSFTKGYDKSSSTWTGKIRKSLSEIANQDALLIERLLMEQHTGGRTYELTEEDKKQLVVTTVRTQGSEQVVVSIPQDEEKSISTDQPAVRESIRIQAMLAEVGERMKMKIWIPRNDREKVIKLLKNGSSNLLESLPMNYDDTTLKTIENIDVLWIRNRSIVRAFEVEHTTSIYSGILRMADLMALQPNLDIKAHIVAPIERKEKVFVEIMRPVFTLLERGPLSKSCTFLSYEAVTELSKEKRLEYMNDGVLDAYAEVAEV